MSRLFLRCNHTKTVPKLYHVQNEVLSPSAMKSLPTHELFTKLGFFSHPKPGLVHWLPLGVPGLTKLTDIIHKRMKEVGAEQVSLSLLSHSSLWQKTDRWKGTELFKLRDSNESEFCLVPTCEEEITELVKNSIKSYKNLPLIYYQINEKFRDEKRPRSGLLRGKEFYMKDAYSFDINEVEAMKSYEKVVRAYYNIFGDLKVPFVKADADTGEIGGSLSHEWHYLHKTAGEDTLFTCDECGNSSNIEKTLSYPQEEEEHTDVSVQYFKSKDSSTLICVYWPSRRELQPNFIKEEIPDIDLNNTDQDSILAEFSDEDALISKKIIRLMDSRLNSRSNFPDFPIKFINRSLITTLTDVPVVSAVEGELCQKCEEGTLEMHKSIEIGHTFFLGDKYLKALDCVVEVPDENGKLVSQNIVMGCYGIGVSRIIAAIGEINRDESGFRWPRAIAPWEITVLNLSKNDEIFEKISSFDYRLDNRENVGLGRKIRQSNMVGIPLVVIVGKHYPMVEVEIRGKRYGEDLQWRKLFDNKDFGWEVESRDGIDVKHLVHVDGVQRVLTALLEDM